MILEEATKEAFGYYPSDFKPNSRKFVLACCTQCGKFKKIRKANYHCFCNSCSLIMGEMHKGKNHYMFGKKLTEAHKALISAAMKGDKHPNYGKHGMETTYYRGGKKLANARQNANRRKLGHIFLMPLQLGEVGHHVTNKHIIGIPKEVHQQFSGHSCKRHRRLVLEWLKANDKKKYILVLCVLAREPLK